MVGTPRVAGKFWQETPGGARTTLQCHPMAAPGNLVFVFKHLMGLCLLCRSPSTQAYPTSHLDLIYASLHHTCSIPAGRKRVPFPSCGSYFLLGWTGVLDLLAKKHWSKASNVLGWALPLDLKTSILLLVRDVEFVYLSVSPAPML